MTKKGKKYLKDVFKQGALPTASNFGLLIDSMFNLEDDEFMSLLDGPLKLYIASKQGKQSARESLLEFYTNVSESHGSSAWSFAVSTSTGDLLIKNQENKSIAQISQNGKIVFNTSDIEFVGNVSRKGERGTFQSTDKNGDEIESPKADGGWHTIVQGVSGVQMYEVVAGVGYPKGSRFAIARATASLVPRSLIFWDFLPRFSSRNARIKVTQAHAKEQKDKIDFKWTPSKNSDHDLQVRTRTDYGANAIITCHITKLWFDPEMTDNFSKEED